MESQYSNLFQTFAEERRTRPSISYTVDNWISPLVTHPAKLRVTKPIKVQCNYQGLQSLRPLRYDKTIYRREYRSEDNVLFDSSIRFKTYRNLEVHRALPTITENEVSTLIYQKIWHRLIATKESYQTENRTEGNASKENCGLLMDYANVRHHTWPRTTHPYLPGGRKKLRYSAYSKLTFG